MVKIRTGDLRSFRGADKSDRHYVKANWQTKRRLFDEDCRDLIQMHDEVYAFKVWEWFGYENAAEFWEEELFLEEKTVKQVQEVLKRCTDAIGLDQVTLRVHGTNQHTRGDSNTTSSKDRGQTYTVARLKRDRPDLADKVINGELSANAAAIEAGFRKRTKSIPIDTVEEAVRALYTVFSVEEVYQQSCRDYDKQNGT